MNSLKRIDAFCLRSLVARNPVSFVWNGGTYTGTTGARKSNRMLDSGGFIDEVEMSLVVPCAQFGETKPAERDAISIYVDTDGIPCESADDATQLSARITTIARAGASWNLTIRTDKK